MTRPRRALGQGSEVAQPDTLLGASGVAVLDRRMGPVARRSLAPGRACAPNVENAADHAAIGHPRHATRLVGQKRRDQGPLRLRHIAGSHRGDSPSQSARPLEAWIASDHKGQSP